VPAPRIVIAVGMAAYPRFGAGNTWASLNWCLGFRELGWDVWVVEAIEKDKLINERGHRVSSLLESINGTYWRECLAACGIERTCTLWAGDEIIGDARDAFDFASEAEGLLNISGHFKRCDLMERCRRRIYLDLDPLFTQVWQTAYGANMNLDTHHVFASVGTRIGKSDCTVPTLGREWLPVVPPISRQAWAPGVLVGAPDASGRPRFTSVTHWHGYPAIEWEGAWYGNKSEEFLKLANLPRQCPGQSLELATNMGHDDHDRTTMIQGGWKFHDSLKICETMATYRRFLEESAGEISAAKNGYVRSRCGWLSDRSVCYLALGRPVILQDTGWPEALGTPPGDHGDAHGLLSFHDLATARRALERVAENPNLHADAARRWAADTFDAGKVAAHLVERAL